MRVYIFPKISINWSQKLELLLNNNFLLVATNKIIFCFHIKNIGIHLNYFIYIDINIEF